MSSLECCVHSGRPHLLSESFQIKVTVGKVDGGVGVENLDPLVLGSLGTSEKLSVGPMNWACCIKSIKNGLPPQTRPRRSRAPYQERGPWLHL